MATFTDPFDPATPPGTQDRSLGDDRIRELKRAIIERLQQEHSFPEASGAGNGRHAFPTGASGARPSDINTGSVFFNTDDNSWEVWNGSSWVKTKDPSKLALTGGTLTGKLTLDGDPTNALHAATKQYVDGFNLASSLENSSPVSVTWTAFQAIASTEIVITEPGVYIIFPFVEALLDVNPDQAVSYEVELQKDTGGGYSSVDTVVDVFIDDDNSFMNYSVQFSNGGKQVIQTLAVNDKIRLADRKEPGFATGTAQRRKAKLTILKVSN